MADTTDIIKALKYWNAERFKKLQRKLTTARNTIDKEALSIQLKPFFTDEEKQVLSEASRVLGSVKRKIEHAKEIKAREEKARDLQLADYKQQRQALLAGLKAQRMPGPCWCGFWRYPSTTRASAAPTSTNGNI